jgi:hypothetical protein
MKMTVLGTHNQSILIYLQINSQTRGAFGRPTRISLSELFALAQDFPGSHLNTSHPPLVDGLTGMQHLDWMWCSGLKNSQGELDVMGILQSQRDNDMLLDSDDVDSSS